MEWWAVLLFFICGLVFLFAIGLPIAFSFLLMDFISIGLLMGSSGLDLLNAHIFTSLSSFVLAPIPLFILMGELMFHSNLVHETIDVLDQWLGRLPGRLGVLAAVSGTIFAATSGSTMANTAMLGTALLPEMKKRGYNTHMSVGPIIGVGGLAMLIPPSALAVVLASIAQISVADMLMAGVVPGVVLGIMMFIYIVIYAKLNPASAPSFPVEKRPLFNKIKLTFKYIIPVAFIIFAVIGLIVLGIATPTEAAAAGVIATMLVAIFLGRFNLNMLKLSLKGSMEVTVMVFMIIAASKTFSSILSYSGASTGLVNMVQGLEISPILILIAMQIILVIMGCFMESVSIMMITLPVFIPIAAALNFNLVWFGVLMLINLEMGQMTPPFGMLLFVMLGVTPPEVTFGDIVKAAVPYMLLDVLIMAMIIIWPQIALWLPSIMSS
jgi:tripartite ATP-independent transporter DctM subunit